MKQLIPLALSINTLALMWLVGDKRTLGWWLGLVGQAGWFLFIFVFEAWGLLPLATALTVVYARNIWRWNREARLAPPIRVAPHPEPHQPSNPEHDQ